MTRGRGINKSAAGLSLSAALAAGLLLVVPAALFAHLALVSSVPSVGDRLAAVPTEIVLTFTQAIEVPLSTVALNGPGGEVAIGELSANEERTVVRAPIQGPVEAGAYTVRWQAVGLDGHPVRGEVVFTVDEGAAVSTPPVTEAPVPVVEPSAASQPPTPTFDPQSPMYAAVRATTYLGIIGTTGAGGFLLLLMGLRRRAAEREEAIEQAIRSAAVLGLLATLVTIIALPLRLQAQSHTLFGAGITGERFSRLVASAWGLSWSVQAAGAVAALVGFLLVTRFARVGLGVAAIGAILLAFSPGLSGHAAAVESLTVPAIISDGLHVFGAGTWLGTLLVLVVIGLPLAQRQNQEVRSSFVHRMVTAFSPIALGAAAIVLATGAFAALLHLDAPTDLWTSGYGRLLTAKLFVVFIVLAAGAYNWRKLQPRTAEPGADLQLRRSAAMELAAAALVIALTSILVAVPPPADDPGVTADAALNSAGTE